MLLNDVVPLATLYPCVWYALQRVGVLRYHDNGDIYIVDKKGERVNITPSNILDIFKPMYKPYNEKEVEMGDILVFDNGDYTLSHQAGSIDPVGRITHVLVKSNFHWAVYEGNGIFSDISKVLGVEDLSTIHRMVLANRKIKPNYYISRNDLLPPD